MIADQYVRRSGCLIQHGMEAREASSGSSSKSATSEARLSLSILFPLCRYPHLAGLAVIPTVTSESCRRIADFVTRMASLIRCQSFSKRLLL